MEHKDDVWSERQRMDEFLTFGLDIGSGKFKLLPLGIDIRSCADIKCDAHFLPFRDKCFVVATLRHVLEHCGPDWLQVLMEAERVAIDIYVFHPRKELWHGGQVYFDLPENYRFVREYRYCNLYKLNFTI